VRPRICLVGEDRLDEEERPAGLHRIGDLAQRLVEADVIGDVEQDVEDRDERIALPARDAFGSRLAEGRLDESAGPAEAGVQPLDGVRDEVAAIHARDAEPAPEGDPLPGTGADVEHPVRGRRHEAMLADK
jgi:hypothetical protein